VSGAKGREPRLLSSINMLAEEEEIANIRLLDRWAEAQKNEVRYKGYFLEDAEIIVFGFGTAGRVAYSAVRAARAEGIKVGLLRPITLSPFPAEQVKELAKQAEAFLVVEMNSGQMLDDLLRICANQIPVEFYGRLGGVVPFPDEILHEIQRIAQGPISMNGDPRKAWLERLKAVI